MTGLEDKVAEKTECKESNHKPFSAGKAKESQDMTTNLVLFPFFSPSQDSLRVLLWWLGLEDFRNCFGADKVALQCRRKRNHGRT